DESERDGRAEPRHDFHEHGRDGRERAVVGRNWRRAACGIDYLARGEVGPLEGCGGATEFALYRAGEAIAEHFAEVGSAGGRADFGFYFWRTAGAVFAAGVRGVPLAR